MTQMIAVCGLDCAACEAYQATQAGDMAALERIAAKWRTEYKDPKIDAKGITCDGCLSNTGRMCGHCRKCGPRLCAVERGLANCAHCPDYGCEKISSLHKFMPEAKARLDDIRAAL
jgi:hypothetical protein